MWVASSFKIGWFCPPTNFCIEDVSPSHVRALMGVPPLTNIDDWDVTGIMRWDAEIALTTWLTCCYLGRSVEDFPEGWVRFCSPVAISSTMIECARGICRDIEEQISKQTQVPVPVPEKRPVTSVVALHRRQWLPLWAFWGTFALSTLLCLFTTDLAIAAFFVQFGVNLMWMTRQELEDSNAPPPEPHIDAQACILHVLREAPKTFTELLQATSLPEGDQAATLKTLVRTGFIVEDFDLEREVWVYGFPQVSDLEDIESRCRRLGI